MGLAASCLLMLALPAMSSAQEQEKGKEGATPAAPAAPAEAALPAEPPAEQPRGRPVISGDTPPADYSTWGLGVGIGLSVLGEDDVKKAEPVGGVVRITDTESYRRAIWLESHYRLFNFDTAGRFGFGPFVGLQFSDDEGLFDSLAAGLMFTMKRQTGSVEAAKNNLGFNVGLGVASSSIHVLGGGVKENEPLPAGEESVRLQKKDDLAFVLLFSFNFLSGFTGENYDSASRYYSEGSRDRADPIAAPVKKGLPSE